MIGYQFIVDLLIQLISPFCFLWAVNTCVHVRMSLVCSHANYLIPSTGKLSAVFIPKRKGKLIDDLVAMDLT